MTVTTSGDELHTTAYITCTIVGNTEPLGFGHVGFLVDDVDAKCHELEQVRFTRWVTL